jgi:hypothetical protein
MAESQNKKFERNLGKAADLRDQRVRNVVELRKNAQDERFKKGREHHLVLSPPPIADIKLMEVPGTGLYYRSGESILIDPTSLDEQYNWECDTLFNYFIFFSYHVKKLVPTDIFGIGDINDFVNMFYTYLDKDTNTTNYRLAYFSPDSYYLLSMITCLYNHNFIMSGLNIEPAIEIKFEGDIVYKFDIYEYVMEYYYDIIDGSRLFYNTKTGFLYVTRGESTFTLSDDCYHYFHYIQIGAFFTNDYIRAVSIQIKGFPDTFTKLYSIYQSILQSKTFHPTMHGTIEKCGVCADKQLRTITYQPICGYTPTGGSKRNSKSNKHSNKRSNKYSKMNRKTRKNRFSLLGKRRPTAKFQKTRTNKPQTCRNTKQRRNQTRRIK